MLADPEQHDGSAKKAGRLDQDLARARKDLEAAMGVWAS